MAPCFLPEYGLIGPQATGLGTRDLRVPHSLSSLNFCFFSNCTSPEIFSLGSTKACSLTETPPAGSGPAERHNFIRLGLLVGARRGGGLRLPGSGLRVRVCKRSEAEEAWASGDSASEPRAPTAIPFSHSFSRGRWVVKPLSGKPSSRSSRLGERPAWSWNRQPPPAGKWPAISQVPHKSRPAPRRLPARGVPRGRVPISFHSRPRGPRKEAGGGPGASFSVPGWGRGRPHAAAVLSQRAPRPASPGRP